MITELCPFYHVVFVDIGADLWMDIGYSLPHWIKSSSRNNKDEGQVKGTTASPEESQPSQNIEEFVFGLQLPVYPNLDVRPF